AAHAVQRHAAPIAGTAKGTGGAGGAGGRHTEEPAQCKKPGHPHGAQPPSRHATQPPPPRAQPLRGYARQSYRPAADGPPPPVGVNQRLVWGLTTIYGAGCPANAQKDRGLTPLSEIKRPNRPGSAGPCRSASSAIAW